MITENLRISVTKNIELDLNQTLIINQLVLYLRGNKIFDNNQKMVYQYH